MGLFNLLNMVLLVLACMTLGISKTWFGACMTLGIGLESSREIKRFWWHFFGDISSWLAR